MLVKYQNLINNRLVWKKFLGQIYGCLPRNKTRRVILSYHSVGSGPLSMPVEKFQAQINWLQEHAVVEDIDTLVQNPGNSGLRVALTFDDGYRSLYTIVAPILLSKRFSATAYINTGWMGEQKANLSDEALGYYPGEEFLLWKEVGELKDSSWIIGSHGVEHLDFTHLSLTEINQQLIESKQQIESKLRICCKHFSYPWGRHNQIVRSAVFDSGYQFATAAHHAPLQKRGNKFCLPRLNIRREYELEDFVFVLSGGWDYFVWLNRVRKIISWL